MAIVKYKVIGSATDRSHYSQIVDVDDTIYITEEEQIDYAEDYFFDDFCTGDIDAWQDEGSEAIDYFSLDKVIKIYLSQLFSCHHRS